MLLTLLAEAETLPVQLRLLALEEVSPNPKVATLAEFASRLEFFERPGRRELVRALYERFQQSAADGSRGQGCATHPVAPPPPIPWWRQTTRPEGLGIGARRCCSSRALVLARLGAGPAQSSTAGPSPGP